MARGMGFVMMHHRDMRNIGTHIELVLNALQSYNLSPGRLHYMVWPIMCSKHFGHPLTVNAIG